MVDRILRPLTALLGVACIILILALAGAGVSAQARRGTPVVDDFYKAPASVPAKPGVLLRSEPFTRDVPKGAKAWRILYTTTLDDATPRLASAIVVTPSDASKAPFPVIAWTHGTTGFDQGSAPSLLPHPFENGGMYILDKLIERGWALVATDYPGLGTAGPEPYLIGQGEGRSALDAVRAAKQLASGSGGEAAEGSAEDRPAGPLGDQTVVWGHSQGGHAALWTGIVAPTYAPDVNVVGVAGLAPASDTVGIVRAFPNIPGSTVLASYLMAAYSAIYPDVDFDAYVKPDHRDILKEMAKTGLFSPGDVLSVLEEHSLEGDPDFWAQDPLTGPLGERLKENNTTVPIEAPLLIAQGLEDALVPPKVQQAYVAARRAAGYEVLYLTYPDRDHVGVVRADSPLIPDLLAWTQDRFDGKPAPSN